MHDEQNVIQQSENYDQFVILPNNRAIHKGHKNALRRAFEEHGNLTLVQPILVNESMHIIDGQHRFEVAKELGLPVFYRTVSGMRIADARSINILHRSWNINDFVKSYADSGDRNYKEYLKVHEDYPFGHLTLVAYLNNGIENGAVATLRHGEFQIGSKEDIANARIRLDKLTEVYEHVDIYRDKYFAYAFLRVLNTPEYDHVRMLRKLDRHGASIIRQYGSIADNIRALEDVYNFQIMEQNRVRFF